MYDSTILCKTIILIMSYVKLFRNLTLNGLFIFIIDTYVHMYTYNESSTCNPHIKFLLFHI